MTDENMFDENGEIITDSNEDEEEESEDEEEESDDDSKEKKAKRKSSLTIQKDKYRKAAKEAGSKLAKAEKELEAFKGKNKEDLSEEEQKEKKAAEYIKKHARDALKEAKEEENQKDADAIQKASDELDEVLTDNPEVTEDEILDTMKHFKKIGVVLSPKQALAAKDDWKRTGKEKPNMPKGGNRGGDEVKNEDQKSFDEKIKGKNIDEQMTIASREAKKDLK